jgi:hypothetical protein
MLTVVINFHHCFKGPVLHNSGWVLPRVAGVLTFFQANNASLHYFMVRLWWQGSAQVYLENTVWQCF